MRIFKSSKLRFRGRHYRRRVYYLDPFVVATLHTSFLLETRRLILVDTVNVFAAFQRTRGEVEEGG